MPFFQKMDFALSVIMHVLFQTVTTLSLWRPWFFFFCPEKSIGMTVEFAVLFKNQPTSPWLDWNSYLYAPLRVREPHHPLHMLLLHRFFERLHSPLARNSKLQKILDLKTCTVRATKVSDRSPFLTFLYKRFWISNFSSRFIITPLISKQTYPAQLDKNKFDSKFSLWPHLLLITFCRRRGMVSTGA